MVSLYSGAGGMDFGFIDAGFVPVWSNDVDPTAVETYRKQIGQTGVPSHDITVGDIRDVQLPKRGAAELVIGGPPCQGFSVAGHMDPNDPRSRHIWEYMRVVERVNPAAFVMENVKALAVNRRWSGTFEALQAEATRLGYDVSSHVLNAAHFGVPQSRERLFLIGVPRGCAPPVPRPVTLVDKPSVRSALTRLPAFGQPGNDSICTARITMAKTPVLRRSPYAGMLFNGHGRPLDVESPAPTLPATMGGNRTPIIDQGHLDGGEPWIIQYHQRLWEHGEAPLTDTPACLRRLTVEEAAAIQTFPREMYWSGSQCAQFRQIGNAVPVTLAYHVALAVRESLLSG